MHHMIEIFLNPLPYPHSSDQKLPLVNIKNIFPHCDCSNILFNLVVNVPSVFVAGIDVPVKKEVVK